MSSDRVWGLSPEDISRVMGIRDDAKPVQARDTVLPYEPAPAIFTIPVQLTEDGRPYCPDCIDEVMVETEPGRWMCALYAKILAMLTIEAEHWGLPAPEPPRPSVTLDTLAQAALRTAVRPRLTRDDIKIGTIA